MKEKLKTLLQEDWRTFVLTESDKEILTTKLESLFKEYLAKGIVSFETVQTDLNKNFNNIRMGAEHTHYLNALYEVRKRTPLPSELSDMVCLSKERLTELLLFTLNNKGDTYRGEIIDKIEKQFGIKI